MAVAILLKNVPITVPIIARRTGDNPLRINEPNPKLSQLLMPNQS